MNQHTEERRKIMTLPARCTEAFADVPSLAVVTIDDDLAERLIRLSKVVKSYGLYAVEFFDHHAQWTTETSADDGPEGMPKERPDYRMEMETCVVTDDSFWWRAAIKHSDPFTWAETDPVSFPALLALMQDE